jgi:hypothetical protein
LIFSKDIPRKDKSENSRVFTGVVGLWVTYRADLPSSVALFRASQKWTVSNAHSGDLRATVNLGEEKAGYAHTGLD